MRNILIMVAALLICSTMAVAQSGSYMSSNRMYSDGYYQGAREGQNDRSVGRIFAPTRSSEYHMGGRYAFEYREIRVFQMGFVQGYRDGYYGFRSNSGGHNAPYGTPYYGGNSYGNSDYYQTPGAVTVFTKTRFGGSVRQFPVGRYSYLVGGWDDQIESLRLNSNVRVILFDEKNFRGERIVLDQSVQDLGGFRDKAASMIIEQPQY